MNEILFISPLSVFVRENPWLVLSSFLSFNQSKCSVISGFAFSVGGGRIKCQAGFAEELECDLVVDTGIKHDERRQPHVLVQIVQQFMSANDWVG